MDRSKWFLHGGRGSGRSFRLLCEAYENKIANLEKENTELRKEVELWKKASETNSYKAFQLQEENKELLKDRDRWMQVDKEDCDNWSKDKKQLTKAKEYIKLLLMNCVGVYESTGKTVAEIQAEAEQFLQEVEE